MAAPEFQTVARVDEIPPGSLKAVQVGDAHVALANVDGEVFAVQGECIHLQGPLAEGHLDGERLTCPWHGWQYDVRTGENFFDRAIRLEQYDVRVEGGEVRVAVSA